MATVWVAVTTATLCAVFAMVLALGQAVSARHRAGGAADLAALAAADHALRGAEAACAAAGEVAEAQGAEIVRCGVKGEIADVAVRAHFGLYAPEVRSRAGPPEGSPPPTDLPPTDRATTGPATTDLPPTDPATTDQATTDLPPGDPAMTDPAVGPAGPATAPTGGPVALS
ncbi:Rv3654c family TadE-like protein [Streptomyces sp. IBSNAI001]|uniref:Rv3654c family TadE-like protein n=1 Tax=Streptomyces sp. IBSNAI001 TaxID=3457499 RepID=UPI003FCFA833